MKYKQETSFNEELKKNIYKISCEKEKKKKNQVSFFILKSTTKTKYLLFILFDISSFTNIFCYQIYIINHSNLLTIIVRYK